MTEIYAVCTYAVTRQYAVTLPEGVTFDQIKKFYVKWQELRYTLDGVVWDSVILREIEADHNVAPDYKDPQSVEVYGCVVGKSEGIAQLAAENDAVLCDIRLSQYDSVDLRGFPGVDADS